MSVHLNCALHMCVEDGMLVDGSLCGDVCVFGERQVKFFSKGC